MKLKFILIVSLFLFPLIVSAQQNSYIGYKHTGVIFGETLPNGVKDLGGGLLSNENYGVTRFSKGKKYMLWLEKISKRDVKGIPSWEVKDTLVFDNLKKNQEFLFSYSSPCSQQGKSNLDLIVKAQFFPQTKTYKVLDAWRANVQKEKFEKISTKNIKCEYIAP